MNKPPQYSEAQKMFLFDHSEELDISQLIDKTGMTQIQIRNFCSRYNLTIKPMDREEHLKAIREAKAAKFKAPPPPFERPKARYDNIQPTDYHLRLKERKL